MSLPSVSRRTSAVVTFVATTAYYASPDVVRSRRTRTRLKGGLVGVISVVSLLEARPDRPDPETSDAVEEVLGSLTGREQAALGAVAVGVVVGGALAVRAAERWIFAHGERRRASGKRLAHTVPALALGAVGAATVLVPWPGDRRPA
ncbi:peptidase S9 [Aeromicrobium sp. IC_218]|uniref:peptidase S9 n=1 Tax=Aeromicrobium sp. IC_218 TaxID=2545468 RepID=UPI00103E0FA5|nr:peptidase S9 [Aeromicrobium sp. IC_218]TCI99527.1 peptidase S9 [Aeromicrobium sp. IC_218]